MSQLLSSLSDAELTKNDIKLAFFDLDGTLINAAGTITPALKREINRIQELGVATAVASGRPYFSATWIIEALSLNAPGVFNTGALIREPATGKTLFEQPLKKEDLISVVNFAREHKVHCELYTADRHFVEEDGPINQIHVQHYLKSPSIIRPFDQVISEESVIKIVLTLHEENESALLEDVMKRYDHLVYGNGKGAGHPELIFSNIISPEASKKRAFDLVLSHLNLKPENVIAFGDSESDMPFLQMAGIGVAMGNAKDKVKGAGNYITESVEEDGVAYALQRLI